MLQPVKVALDAFYDMGFDPRFSKDGNYFHPQDKHSLKQRIAEIFNYTLFTCKAYLSPSKEERHVRKLLLKCAKLETVWTKLGQQAFAYGNDKTDPSLVQYTEHDFFERTSDLYKSLKKAQALPRRLFPSELLAPIHSINKPQSTSQTAEIIKNHPGRENGDLSRQVSNGFARLSKNFLDFHPLDDQTKNKYYVPHDQFIKATEPSVWMFKDTCRNWRENVAHTIVDKKCAKSFQECRAELKKDLNKFESAWNFFIRSHELLKEVSEPFSQKDYYENYYRELRFKSYFPKDLYMNISGYLYDSSHARENKAHDAGYESLKKDFADKYSHTLTGDLYKKIGA
ncbi:MAG TPA: hypothetical protein VLG49_00495 [Rhabdochlamydiaceae bacterium]|nr:hypothetical protein [Rhabdochlamydiaceae bacterium]